MPRHPTAPDTNNGTAGSSIKKRGRPAKIKPQVPAEVLKGGNPEFKITSGVEADVQARIAAENQQAANSERPSITDEDRALDLELERMARDSAPPVTMAPVSDADVVQALTKENVSYEHLKDHLDDYKPAVTLGELEDQVSTAKLSGCDSIYASEKIIRHFCRNKYPSDVGYFFYKDVRVFIDGFFEKAMAQDKRTVWELGKETITANK